MKISIIVPAYNEEENIRECLEALIAQDYPKKNYEIIIVDDCSTDKTPEIIKNISENAKEIDIFLKHIIKDRNEGQLLARINGANEASNNLLLFIDSRCIVDRDTLKNIKKINYMPIVGNIIIRYENSISRFYYLVRKKLYYPYFGEEFESIKITKDNFDKIPTGTGIFFCDKKLFLSSQPINRGKDVSDDIKLLWNIVQKKKILRHSNLKGKYLARSSLREEIKHTFHRGPKFVDYYLDLRKERFWIFIFLPLILLFTVFFLYVTNSIYFIYSMYSLFFVNLLIAIWISENINDFFLSLLFFPIIGLAFQSGILNGLIIKVLTIAHTKKREGI